MVNKLRVNPIQANTTSSAGTRFARAGISLSHVTVMTPDMKRTLVKNVSFEFEISR